VSERLKAPFCYFGGKGSVAHLVWEALGNPSHYIEPFFGSGAVLLARPNDDGCETVNDKDGFIANVWRSLQKDPDEVAKWCDWPVNHVDLNCRRKKLIANEARLVENLVADDDFCDPKLAGYWIWAASCWIGSGLTQPDAIPHISHAGKGVHAQIPHIGDSGMGVQEPYNIGLYKWFRKLSERLRRVRVVCGDWTRVCGGNWQDKMGTCGVYFDAPYTNEGRDSDIYHHDSGSLAPAIIEWSAKRGAMKDYRIVISGYEEYAPLLKHGWCKSHWSAAGGYGNTGGKQETNQNQNRHRETLYFSPNCSGGEIFEI